MNTTVGDDVVPARPVINRLIRDQAEIGRLLSLLAAVHDGYRFTNRLDEAVLLVPETVMAEIRRVIGAAPDNSDEGEPPQ